MTLFDRISYNIRHRGIARTFQLILSEFEDVMFDIRLGTDTYGKAYLDDLKVKGNNVESGVDYQPTRARPLKRLFYTLALPKDGVLVDMGCGKGRVLLLACEYGFREIIGVEFAAELCEIARSNLHKYEKKKNQSCHATIIHADVVDHRFQDHETIFFLFNPFGIDVLQVVINNISNSINRAPRKVWLIFYHTPTASKVMNQTRLHFQLAHYNIFGNEFDVYIFDNDLDNEI